MNEACGLVSTEHNSQHGRRGEEVLQNPDTFCILQVRWAIDSLSVGKGRIAGRRQINTHFTPLYLWVHLTITAAFCNLKRMSRRDAWKPLWTVTWHVCIFKLEVPPWEELEGWRGKGACAQRRRRIKAQGGKDNSSHRSWQSRRLLVWMNQTRQGNVCVYMCVYQCTCEPSDGNSIWTRAVGLQWTFFLLVGIL